jgi:arylsulfatase A-like enzyme
MKSATGLLAIVYLFARAASAAVAADSQSPNLVIIHTDEHNFRTLGCYRDLMSEEQAFVWGKDAVVTTPHIDRIADEGAICTSFYATTPVCSPSRSSFVSGRYPHNTPVYTNNIALNDEIVTFAEILRRQGYATGYAGKWHLDGGGKPQWEPRRRFGFEDNRYMFNRGHWKQFEDTGNGPRVKARDAAGRPTYAVAGADERSFATDFLADKTVEFIKANQQKPFCWMLSLPDPHGPDTVRPPYDAMFTEQTSMPPPTFDKDPTGLPGWAKPDGKFQEMAQYFGMVKCIDDNVGKIVGTLREEGLLDHTIVVFTSDHGDLRGEHHRQNKGVPFEGSAKIPFVIRYPGKIKAGTVIDEALDCTDFLPTILALMDCKTAGKEEGRDASVLFTAGKAPDDWQDIAFLRGTGEVAGWVAAVSDRYKLIYSTHDDPWLFDLEQDPDELKNGFSDPANREVVRAMSKALAAYGKRVDDPRVAVEKVRGDLTWAIEGEGPYVPTPAAKAPKKSRPGRGGRKTKQTSP